MFIPLLPDKVKKLVFERAHSSIVLDELDDPASPMPHFVAHLGRLGLFAQCSSYAVCCRPGKLRTTILRPYQLIDAHPPSTLAARLIPSVINDISASLGSVHDALASRSTDLCFLDGREQRLVIIHKRPKRASAGGVACGVLISTEAVGAVKQGVGLARSMIVHVRRLEQVAMPLFAGLQDGTPSSDETQTVLGEELDPQARLCSVFVVTVILEQQIPPPRRRVVEWLRINCAAQFTLANDRTRTDDTERSKRAMLRITHGDALTAGIAIVSGDIEQETGSAGRGSHDLGGPHEPGLAGPAWVRIGQGIVRRERPACEIGRAGTLHVLAVRVGRIGVPGACCLVMEDAWIWEIGIDYWVGVCRRHAARDGRGCAEATR